MKQQQKQQNYRGKIDFRCAWTSKLDKRLAPRDHSISCQRLRERKSSTTAKTMSCFIKLVPPLLLLSPLSCFFLLHSAAAYTPPPTLSSLVSTLRTSLQSSLTDRSVFMYVDLSYLKTLHTNEVTGLTCGMFAGVMDRNEVEICFDDDAGKDSFNYYTKSKDRGIVDEGEGGAGMRGAGKKVIAIFLWFLRPSYTLPPLHHTTHHPTKTHTN